MLAEKINEINQGTYREIPKTKFREFAQNWLKTYAEVNVKPSTFARYKDIIHRLLIPAWGHHNLTNLTTGHLQRYVAERLKSVSPKTVSNEVGVIKEIFRHAYRWGCLKTNLSEHLDRPRIIRPEIKILSPEEVGKILAKTAGRYRLAFLTSVLTGLRAGELWALRWSDIDWNALQINIRQSLWRGLFQPPKSKSSFRKVDIPEQLAFELKEWRLSSPPNDQDLVFPNTKGKPAYHDNVVKRHFVLALRRAGLRHMGRGGRR